MKGSNKKTEEYITKRLEQLRQAQRSLEQELLTIRVIIGELEVALDPDKLLQEQIPEDDNPINS